MDLLSEDRDPIGTLQYALARVRGQENQQKMKNTNNYKTITNPIGTTEVHYVRRNNTQQRTEILAKLKTNPIPSCWKCGQKFIPGHLNICPAKQEKKIAEVAKKLATTPKCVKQKCHPEHRKEHNIETSHKTGTQKAHTSTITIKTTQEE